MSEFQTLNDNVVGDNAGNSMNLLASMPFAYGTNSSGFNVRVVGEAENQGCQNNLEAIFFSREIVNVSNGYVEQVGIFEISYNATQLQTCCGRSAVETSAPIRCIKDAE